MFSSNSAGPPYQTLIGNVDFQLNSLATINAGGVLTLNQGVVLSNGTVQVNANSTVSWNSGNISATTPDSSSISILK
jgi:hypothetical protein